MATDNILSVVTVDGQGGNDVLSVNDQASTGQESYDVEATRFTRTPLTFGQPIGSPTQIVNYANVESLAVHAGTNFDGLGAGSTSAGTSTALYGGPGQAEFVIENGHDTLDDIQGPLALHGGGRANFAFVTDELDTVGHTFTLTANTVQRDGIAPITYDGFGEFILATGDNTAVPPTPDTVNVLSTAAGTFTIVPVGSGDTVILGRPTGTGSARTLQDFQGPFRVQSVATEAPTVVIDDSGDPDTAGPHHHIRQLLESWILRRRASAAGYLHPDRQWLRRIHPRQRQR